MDFQRILERPMLIIILYLLSNLYYVCTAKGKFVISKQPFNYNVLLNLLHIFVNISWSTMQACL